MNKLDRSRSFTEVFGTTEDGCHFVQDGKRFDHQDREISAKRATKPKAKTTKSAAKAKSPVEIPNNQAYDAWTPKQLQAAHKQRTGKGFKVGTSKEDMVKALQALDAG